MVGFLQCTILSRVPKCKFLSHAAASSAAATAVNELVVIGCGVSMANGTYKRTQKMFNGLPMYTKMGQITFIISSTFDDNIQQWRVQQQNSKKYMYKSENIYRVGGKLDGAPLDNSAWKLVKDGVGVHPPPQVKRG